MAMSFNPLCQEMLKEWLGESHKFKILFDSSQHYNQIEAFHKCCDRSESTVTIFYTNHDSVFGGYTRQSWQPSSNPGYKDDKRAFLFQLFDRGTFNPKKNPVRIPRCAIYCHSSYGPTFGGGQGGEKDIVTQTDTGHQASVTVRTAIGQAYKLEKPQILNFTDGPEKVVKFEVFLVIDDKEYVEKAWRNVTHVAVESLRKDLEGFKPPGALQFTTILLVGQIGAGKSSYLNSLTSAFRGHVTSSVPTGSAPHSLTLQNEQHSIYTEPSKEPLKLRLWDTRGFEQGMSQSMVSDIQDIIRGRPPSSMRMLTLMSNLWNRQPERQLTQREEELLQQKIHCVAFVIDGTVIDGLPQGVKDAFAQIKKTANEDGIPQTVLLTKIDKVSMMVNNNLSLALHSTQVRDLVEQTATLFELPRSHVFPVKNYEHESELNDDVDRLTLLSFRQMMRFTDDFLFQ
ncbi:interferon-induced protein 44-like [Haliotis asinina]|uniref:interferon-induced protein 44-like n=1 Tax=Haliotis asinina TaxID=109174 RepID=UPI0035327669